MTPIFWQRALVQPVREWDRLDSADCERLVRGLYRSAGLVPAVTEAVAEAVAHSGGKSTVWARAAAAREAR